MDHRGQVHSRRLSALTLQTPFLGCAIVPRNGACRSEGQETSATQDP